MESRIEGLVFEEVNNENIRSGNKTTQYDSFLSRMLSICAILSCILFLLGAFILGFAKVGTYDTYYFDDFNPTEFFGCLLCAIISFSLLKALSEIIKAVNKYLS